MFHQFTNQLAALATQTLDTAYTHAPLVGVCVSLAFALTILYLLYPQLSVLAFARCAPVEVLDVQTIIRSGGANRQREVVFTILNGTGAPIRVVEGIISIFGVNGILIYSQEHELCHVPEGIEPISMRIIRIGQGFKIPAHVVPNRVEVRVKNWK